MNYINLINSFWEKDGECNFSDKEIALYFYLLSVCNRLTWKNPFGQSNAMMAAKFGWGKSAFDTAKKKLKDAGLIDFKAGDGRGNVYQYEIVLEKKGIGKGTQKLTLSDTLSDTLSNTLSNLKPETSINLNETKQDNPPLPPAGGNPPRGEVFLPIDRFFENLIGSSWIESVGMDYGCKPQEVKDFLAKFHGKEKLIDENAITSDRDYRKHFLNWLRIQLEQQQKNGTRQQQPQAKGATVIPRGNRL